MHIVGYFFMLKKLNNNLNNLIKINLTNFIMEIFNLLIIFFFVCCFIYEKYFIEEYEYSRKSLVIESFIDGGILGFIYDITCQIIIQIISNKSLQYTSKLIVFLFLINILFKKNKLWYNIEYNYL